MNMYLSSIVLLRHVHYVIPVLSPCFYVMYAKLFNSQNFLLIIILPSVSPLDYTLRDARESDAESIWRVHTASIKKVCSSHYSLSDVEIWSQRQRPEKYIRFILEDIFIVSENSDGQVLGFGHMQSHKKLEKFPMTESSHRIFEVKGLYVLPEMIRKGVGTVLYRELERRANMLGCSSIVVSASLNAVAFYSYCGFHEKGKVIHCMQCDSGEQHKLRCVSMEKNFPRVHPSCSTSDSIQNCLTSQSDIM